MSTIKSEEKAEECFTRLEKILAGSKNNFEISQKRFLHMNNLLVDINKRLDEAQRILKAT